MTDKAQEIAREKARAFREQYLLNVALASGSGKKGLLKQTCDLAEKAFTEALLTFSDERTEKIGEGLVTAMRQWKHYAEMGEDDDGTGRDLTTEESPEGELYRECLALLGLAPAAIRREAAK